MNKENNFGVVGVGVGSITKRRYVRHCRTVVISARMPVELVEQIDTICAETNRTRSDVLGRIVEIYLDFERKEKHR